MLILSKNTWQGINQIKNINSKGNKRPSSLIVNKKLISDPSQVANSFSDYFSTIVDKLQAKVYHLPTGFPVYLTNANKHNFFVKPTNPIEIIINNLDSNKATGPYGIINEILYLIKLNIAEPLSILINLSFEKAFYLKISKVIPVYKEKGNIFDSSIYRPISLLSNINNIIEN